MECREHGLAILARMTVQVEINVESVAGVLAARLAGADRVELCSGLADGGLTPSAALIETSVASGGSTEVHVLIRPRPGGFHYTRDEVDVMVRDIATAVRYGAAGVVTGALDHAGHLDDRCAALVEAAEGLPVTLHRAIDVSADSRRALDRAVEFGFARVLTSGRRRSVLDGAPLIRELVRRAGGALPVMACGGVRPANAIRVLESTGVADLHAAMRVAVSGSAGERAGDAVCYAAAGVPDGFDHFETDAEGVAELCSLVREHGSPGPVRR